ncbi:MAG: hypothetical protein ACTHNS_09245 [Marmoricola sp.]
MAAHRFEALAGSPVEVLDAVAAADAAERREAAAKLGAVLAWAHAHPAGAEDAASWAIDHSLLDDEDGLDRLGGAGTPAVAEFAVEQLATRLRISSTAAMGLVADVLNLAHRHPALWDRVQTGACPAWTARRIADACSTLPVEAAAWVDGQVGHLAGRCTQRRIDAALAYAVAKWDPKKLREAEEQARDARHLDLELPGQNCRPSNVATAAIRGQLSPTDALKFDALVAAQAARLAEQGDTSSLDIRRAKALGVIADALMTGELDLATIDHAEGRGPAKRRSSLPATLFVHVRIEDLLAHLSGEDRIGRIEKLGPATLDLLAQWLGDTDLRIRPVLDMGRTDAVDAHDPPAWMRELVIQRDRHCAFPGCDRDARTSDLDHVDPYVPMDEGGPPGQTSPANLAPLCRRHHRCKTFTAWRYQRLPDGDYQWTSPDGSTYRTLI